MLNECPVYHMWDIIASNPQRGKRTLKFLCFSDSTRPRVNIIRGLVKGLFFVRVRNGGVVIDDNVMLGQSGNIGNLVAVYIYLHQMVALRQGIHIG